MYGKELRCLNTKGKYGKITNIEIKWSIISKSVMIIIFVELIDQLIDFPINRASLSLKYLLINKTVLLIFLQVCFQTTIDIQDNTFQKVLYIDCALVTLCAESLLGEMKTFTLYFSVQH